MGIQKANSEYLTAKHFKRQLDVIPNAPILNHRKCVKKTWRIELLTNCVFQPVLTEAALEFFW